MIFTRDYIARRLPRQAGNNRPMKKKKVTVVIDVYNGRIWRGIVRDDIDVRLIAFDTDHMAIWDRPVMVDIHFVEQAEELADMADELGVTSDQMRQMQEESKTFLCNDCKKRLLNKSHEILKKDGTKS